LRKRDEIGKSGSFEHEMETQQSRWPDARRAVIDIYYRAGIQCTKSRQFRNPIKKRNVAIQQLTAWI
jgi:hypothetical protein